MQYIEQKSYKQRVCEVKEVDQLMVNAPPAPLAPRLVLRTACNIEVRNFCFAT